MKVYEIGNFHTRLPAIRWIVKMLRKGVSSRIIFSWKDSGYAKGKTQTHTILAMIEDDTNPEPFVSIVQDLWGMWLTLSRVGLESNKA